MSTDTVVTRLLSRKNVSAVIIALVVILAGVLFALLRLLAAPSPQLPTPTTGIDVVQVIYGPGVGKNPFFDAPMGVAYDKAGRIYVADTGNNRVCVFDEDGRFDFEFGGLGIAKPASGVAAKWAPGLLNYPTDIAVDSDGSVYVADFRNDQVQVFDSKGRFVRAFPDNGKKVGKGASGQGGTGVAASSVAVNGGLVFVADRYQLLVFDSEGKLVDQFGRPGIGPTELDHPNGVAIGADRTMAISDSNNNRVLGWSLDGEPLWALGQPYGATVSKATTGSVDIPRGIASRDDGSFVVADAAASRLVVISPDGEVLAAYGAYGASPGQLNFPVDVAVRNDRLAIAEKGGDRIQVIVLDED